MAMDQPNANLLVVFVLVVPHWLFSELKCVAHDSQHIFVARRVAQGVSEVSHALVTQIVVRGNSTHAVGRKIN
jgi:hypothetical protein